MGRESNANIQAQEQFERQTIINFLAEKKELGPILLLDLDRWQILHRIYVPISPGWRRAGDRRHFVVLSPCPARQPARVPCLEPGWTSLSVTGNDYHPNSIIQPGEQLILHDLTTLSEMARNGMKRC